MTTHREIRSYITAVLDLELILGPKPDFLTLFQNECLAVRFITDTEPGAKPENPDYILDQESEKQFLKLKQWVIDNYPWPEKKQ